MTRVGLWGNLLRFGNWRQKTLGSRVWGWESQDLGFVVWSFGFRAQGLMEVWSSGFKAQVPLLQGLRFKEYQGKG